MRAKSGICRNQHCTTAPLFFLAICLLLIAMAPIARGHWPDHRGNLQRTAFVQQPISGSNWQFAWSSNYLTAPQAAWPPPARGSLWQELSHIEPRLNDDQADSPIIARDLQGALHLLMPSSANDRVVNFNPHTGSIRWEYVADAPVRFAPTVREDVVYFGADDGKVRALDLATGQLRWQAEVGPGLPWIMGNNRLISPHPIRTSVIFHDESVYACAGLFPSQGVFAACLDARQGSLKWRRRIEKSPQGYMLLADQERLIIPEGRAAPFMLNMSDGQPLAALPSPGGSFCMLTPEAFFAGPGNAPRVESFPLEKDFRPRMKEEQPVMLPLEGRATAAGNGLIWVATGKQLVCYNAGRILNQAEESVVWSRDCDLKQSLIVSGQPEDLQLFVAGGPNIQVYRASTGDVLKKFNIPDSHQHADSNQEIVYLAVAAGSEQAPQSPATLVATTKSGAVFCWHESTPAGDRSGDPSADLLAPSLRGTSVEPSQEANKPAADFGHLSIDQQVKNYLADLPVKTGAILVLGDRDGSLSEAIVQQSRFRVVNVLDDSQACQRLQSLWQQQRIYGAQAVARYVPRDAQLPMADEIFNAVIEAQPSGRGEEELQRLLAPGSGRLFRPDQPVQAKPLSDKLGAWRHQYCNPANHSATHDDRLATATTFRLQWFGGVGPQPMPDRHLRGQAPLAAGAALVMHGDGCLIGVDPANGFERWRKQLPPGSMRYVMPYDGGYSCLTLDGQTLFTCTSESLWKIDSLSGDLSAEIPVPAEEELRAQFGLNTDAQFRWGYLSESSGWLFATLMKSTAPRLAINDPSVAREKYSDQDYTSGRPLVCSRSLHCLSHFGKTRWIYQGGVIVNSTISVQTEDVAAGKPDDRLDGGRVVLVESRSAESLSHSSDRIPMATLMQDAWLICLDAQNGQVLWQQSIHWPGAANILYTQVSDGFISLVTSASDEQADRASYAVRVARLEDGEIVWQHGYPHVKKGLYHGEQVHHPVILKQPNGLSLLVVEPYLFDLRSGKRQVPNGASQDWSLQRPGHSCGSLSGCGYNLFFRANNPTVLNLQSGGGGQFTALSPSRPGCWINMIPAAGRLLIPEASASCVCHYPIQTSMAFVPVYADDPTTVPASP